MTGATGVLTVLTSDHSGCGIAKPACMRPVSFAGCFGWLHTPAHGTARTAAVVLCSGVRNDAITGQRSFRLLADALAAAGYPTLRFDYPGTGDSAEFETTGPDATEHWAAWQQSVHAAADWLRDHSPSRHIVLCGLRLGATLAAVVAGQRSDVAGLVLLAPVLRGGSYIRQLSVEANLHNSPAQPNGGLVLHELRLSRETVTLISQVDLRKAPVAPPCRVAVYAQVETPVLTECADAWRCGGTQVTCEDFAGLEPMLRPAFMNHEPPAEVARIAAWLRAAVPAEPARLQQARMPADAVIRTGGCIETPLQFGVGGDLFGVLCRPVARPENDLVVVIGNGGGLPHSAAVSVDLTRRLAAAGYASLRMDFAGVADSKAAADASTHLFEADRRPDFAAAIDALEALGYRRFALQGMCSGSYHAFHAALADARVCQLLLVNHPMFQWRVGTPIEYLNHVVENPSHLLRKLARKDLWLQLIQGRLDLRSRLAALHVWFVAKVKTAGRRLAGLFGYAPSPSFPMTSMRRLSSRTRTFFLFSERDAGVAELAQAFGPNQTPPGATLRIVPGLDHALTGREMQRIAAEEMIAFLRSDPAGQTSPRPREAALRSVSGA